MTTHHSFLHLSLPSQFQRNTHVGVALLNSLATDKDTERNGVADYTLTAGPEAVALFGLQVAEDRGEKLPQLIVLGGLDRERKDSYDLTIKAVDGGNPPRYSSALLRVVIADANAMHPNLKNPPTKQRLQRTAQLDTLCYR